MEKFRLPPNVVLAADSRNCVLVCAHGANKGDVAEK